VTTSQKINGSTETSWTEQTIAVVVLTYERVGLLRQCVENVLTRTSARTAEIVIWNNGSTDGTRDYLDSLDDPRIRVVHSPANIGQNAYDHAFEQTTAPYLLELDDDMIDAPPDWDALLLEAFLALPEFGYLAANLVNNPNDTTAKIMYGENAHLYHEEVINGIKLKIGPTGGGCSLTSRELWKQLGGFGQNSSQVFWLEDSHYLGKLHKLGYRSGYLADVEVFHAGGSYYGPIGKEKAAFWNDFFRRIERKNRVKRVLLALPIVPRLNRRFGWFVPPPDRAQVEKD
jgi:GT2 family glycosyltransferase